MLDLRLALRPRTPWEAADLGLALLRAQAGPVYRTWLVLLLPLALVLAVACREHPWLAPLILWWLKPALDRPVLHVLAKATFGGAPGVAETLRGAPGYCRKGVAASLLWRRFSEERSLLLPVWQLEEPSPAGFRKRRKVLFQRGRAQARLLTWVCLLFTVVLAVGALAGISYFRPGTGGPSLVTAVFASRGHRLAWLDLQAGQTPGLSAVFIMSPEGRCIASSDRTVIGHEGSFRPYVGVDVSGAMTRTSQSSYVAPNYMDNRTLKSLAPNYAAAFYLGVRF